MKITIILFAIFQLTVSKLKFYSDKEVPDSLPSAKYLDYALGLVYDLHKNCSMKHPQLKERFQKKLDDIQNALGGIRNNLQSY